MYFCKIVYVYTKEVTVLLHIRLYVLGEEHPRLLISPLELCRIVSVLQVCSGSHPTVVHGRVCGYLGPVAHYGLVRSYEI